MDKRDFFKDKFEELSVSKKVELHNKFCENQNRMDEEIHPFTEDFFDTFFSESSPMDIIRSWAEGETPFGCTNSMDSSYIRFDKNDYLQTMTDDEAESVVEDLLDEIIDDYDWRYNEILDIDDDWKEYFCEELRHRLFLESYDLDEIEEFFDDEIGVDDLCIDTNDKELVEDFFNWRKESKD